MQADLIDRLATALGRIIDDPLVVKILLERDPQAWADAVNVLDEAEGDDTEEYGPDTATEQLERGPR